MIHQESWYREASPSDYEELRRLERQIKDAEGSVENWFMVERSGALERAWLLAERLHTLPLMDIQQAEMADEKTGSARTFTVVRRERTSGPYMQDPWSEWKDLPDLTFNFVGILREFSGMVGFSPDAVSFILKGSTKTDGYWPTVSGAYEQQAKVIDLDKRGHLILLHWATDSTSPLPAI